MRYGGGENFAPSFLPPGVKSFIIQKERETGKGRNWTIAKNIKVGSSSMSGCIQRRRPDAAIRKHFIRMCCQTGKKRCSARKV